MSVERVLASLSLPVGVPVLHVRPGHEPIDWPPEPVHLVLVVEGPAAQVPDIWLARALGRRELRVVLVEQVADDRALVVVASAAPHELRVLDPARHLDEPGWSPAQVAARDLARGEIAPVVLAARISAAHEQVAEERLRADGLTERVEQLTTELAEARAGADRLRDELTRLRVRRSLRQRLAARLRAR